MASRRHAPATFLFHDPCFGHTRESLSLPAAIRAAAQALAGVRTTLDDALARLRAAAGDGEIELAEDRRFIRYVGPAVGGSRPTHFLIRYK